MMLCAALDKLCTPNDSNYVCCSPKYSISRQNVKWRGWGVGWGEVRFLPLCPKVVAMTSEDFQWRCKEEL